jgi:hypothetical protein
MESAVCRSALQRLRAIDWRRRLDELEHDASRANVAFHPLGLFGVPLRISRSPYGFRAFPWEELSASTAGVDAVPMGGFTDLSHGLERIMNELSGYYLLGYRPSNETADSRFREIEVKVRRPGVDVSARRGYYARTDVMARAAAAVSPSREPRMTTPVAHRRTRERTAEAGRVLHASRARPL